MGKLADFVELAADPPYAVDPPAELADKATVSGTWLSGERIDLATFVAAVTGTDPGPHEHLADHPPRHTCC